MRLGALVLLLAVTGACAFGVETPDVLPRATDFDIEQDTAPPPASDVADVVEEVLPSVVNVRVRSFALNSVGGEDVRGQGSGVIIDRDGIILTNFHVVSDAVKVEVFFTEDDRESVEGTVIGTSPERDLAVIQVPEDDLTPIEVGKSSSLRLGDTAIALGFPLGLGGPTVTTGIISGEERTIEVPGDQGPQSLEGMLQTDAAINPGNSGGPLVDAAGRLIGINTAAASAGSAENIGFAISIDAALPVVREVLTEPQEERAWLGVIISRTFDENAAVQLGLDADVRGALVTDLVPGGPAEDAGIEPGDVITGIDGDEITSGDDLTETLTGLDPGDEVSVDVVNVDGDRTIELVLAERPITFER